MINIQNALKMASKFISNDKITKALEISKNVNSPQSAIKALSQIGDPNQIIDNGLDKLNNPMAQKMANMFGATNGEFESLKREILGMKNTTPVQQKVPNSRIQDLINGLK